VSVHYPLPGGGRWVLAATPRGGWAAVRSVPLYARVALHLLALLLGWATYRLLARHDHDLMLADRDALTGLLNRKSFNLAMEDALLHAKPGGCALVLIDLDQFKPVNDLHGHRVGDQVLQHVGERLLQFEHGLDAAYRLGGDEFALLLHGERAMRDLFRQVEHAMELIRQPIVVDPRRHIGIGASVGVAVFPLGTEDESVHEVFDRADRALYRCKAQGGSRVHADPQAHPGH
jgi:diguanylate cyclase (GGDEF)-like protein